MAGGIHQLELIDSHTAGEPTRVVVSGVPAISGADLTEIRSALARHHDGIRTACVTEPRGHDAMVGAILVPPRDPSCETGVVFFNNVGYLNGCVHGTIGVVETLAYLGRIESGECRIETPVGVVTAVRDPSGMVTVTNVPSYRYRKDCRVEVPGYGTVSGDVAWGGNWFFLIDGQGPEVAYKELGALAKFTGKVRAALEAAEITGADGDEIDHIEVFGPPGDPAVADSRNFVLCPGGAYDRSPCGTGTSAKLACLADEGHLKDGEVWRQASILDTVFEGRVVSLGEGRFQPHISGQAYVNGETSVLFNDADPFCYGIPSEPQNIIEN